VGSNPSQLAIDSSNNVWVSCPGNHLITGVVTKLSNSGVLLGTYNTGNWPGGIAIDSYQNVWVADWTDARLLKFSNSGVLIGTYGADWGGAASRFITIAPDDTIWCTQDENYYVKHVANDGSLIGAYSINTGDGVKLDSSGNVWFASNGSGTTNVFELSSSGVVINAYIANFISSGLSIDSSGNIWVTSHSEGGSTVNAITILGNNGNPVLTSVSPSFVEEGSGNTVITLSGSGFVSNSTAYFNSTALVTTFVSSIELTATIPSSLLVSVSSSLISVSQLSGTSNTEPFTVISDQANQVVGGNFVDSEGNPLENGFLLFELSQDGIVNTSTRVCSNYTVQISLNSSGSISSIPSYFLFPNDTITPSGTFYIVSAFTAEGQKVWGPNVQNILSTPSPFNVSAWVPGQLN
jgi:hypothetical protein